MTDRKIFEKKLDDGRREELYENEGGSPEIFIDGAWGAAIGTDGIFKINLFTRGISSDLNVERREVAARLTMTGVTLSSLAKFLNERVQDMVEHGIDFQKAESSQEKSSPPQPRGKKSPSTKPKGRGTK